MIDLRKFRQEDIFLFSKLSSKEERLKIKEIIKKGDLKLLYVSMLLTPIEIDNAIMNGEDLYALYEKYRIKH